MTNLTLLELNQYIKQAVSTCFPDSLWVVAETSDVRLAANGHCYMELVEKDELTGSIVARNRANIWKQRYGTIRTLFESTTGQLFVSGIKVLVEVSVTYHEAYGLSLTIQNINPTYTLGEMERRRREILDRLQREGWMRRNGECLLPPNPQRLAIISAPTAAGYEDFMHQLSDTPFAFYTRLFPAVMQGMEVESSIGAALRRIERIQQEHDCFDATVIIRGGGASTDLNGFDNYELAVAIARHPLPVLTGIGHERDETIPDFVAHTRLKTPTAVAAFLVGRMEQQLDLCHELSQIVTQEVQGLLQRETLRLANLRHQIPLMVQRTLHRHELFLTSVLPRIAAYADRSKEGSMMRLNQLWERIVVAWGFYFRQENNSLAHFLQLVEAHAPDEILKRGFSIARVNGKLLTSVEQVQEGDHLETLLVDGKVESTVSDKQTNV